MGIAIFKNEINLDKLPEVIKEVRILWIEVYDRSPLLAYFIVFIIPATIWYAIYTYGGVRKSERSTDEGVRKDYEQSKKQRRKKK